MFVSIVGIVATDGGSQIKPTMSACSLRLSKEVAPALRQSTNPAPGLRAQSEGGRSAYLEGKIICVSGAASNLASSDAALLLSSIRSGDEQAMAELYDRYSSIVYSVALRVLGDTAAAEDILQDVFMQLWRTPDAFDAKRGSFPGWLAVIARNRAIDAMRKRRPESDITEIVISIEPDLAGGMEWSRALEKIRSALASMSSPQRSALEMAFFEGLTHTEIAAKTGEPLGTIKTRIRSALVSLRKAFNL